MNVKEKFSEFMKKDALGQYHIRVGQTIYVVPVVKKLNLQSGRNEYHIVQINRIANNGYVVPVAPYDIFSKNWLIKALWYEIKKENRAAFERYQAAESGNSYHRWRRELKAQRTGASWE